MKLTGAILNTFNAKCLIFRPYESNLTQFTGEESESQGQRSYE